MSILNWFCKRMDDWDERRALVQWNNAEPWTIGDSFEGVQVFGDTGSGKTSTSARVLSAAMLRAGYGGLVLTVKPEDTAQWQRSLDENGRKADALFFGPEEGTCFNFLEYELRHGAGLGLGSKNATRILVEMVSMAQRDGGAGDPFWRQSAEVLIGHTLDLMSAAQAVPSMVLANEIIQSGPFFADQVKDTQWRERSKCWELIARGRERARGTHDFQQAEAYWLRDFPLLPEKTRQSIVATFTAAVAHHFCSEAMHRMFGGRTTVSPADIFGGRILVINLPLLKYGPAGRFASIVWKYCTQLALERRTDRRRPVFIFSDECHYFLTRHDQLFQTTARSARCAVVYLTQNRSNYYAESPGDAGRNRVDSMCACLKTQIMHQCSHDATRKAFADAIGKRRIARPSVTHNFGHGKTTHSETEQLVDEHWVLPDEATKLRTGGEAHKCRVTVLVTRAGKRFSNGKPYLVARFDQRNYEPSSWSSRTAVAIPKPKRQPDPLDEL
ncbi:MAG TPA: type IV secretion system DNA-binding domain-containing protein [Dongiaceae bacterium]|nr:type IV secretion system DNA-binding domain-containing protein [Dongiaceae bacterium]